MTPKQPSLPGLPQQDLPPQATEVRVRVIQIPAVEVTCPKCGSSGPIAHDQFVEAIRHGQTVDISCPTCNQRLRCNESRIQVVGAGFNLNQLKVK